MVVKIYISGMSGNKEVKKRQQRVLMILDSKNIKYDVVDITEPGNETAKEFMQNNATSLGATVGDANPRFPLPPQIFNEEDYCGDYEQFDLANEMDEIEKYLKLSVDESNSIVTSSVEFKLGNGEIVHQDNADDNEAEAKENTEPDNLTENKLESDNKIENDVTEVEA